jgi:formylglycine-generating enzyme required for sulfatase activity/energy-coupling factor transporter ATP-binding protein EcfA2
MTDTPDEIQRKIAELEALRPSLGDAAVDAAIAALRAQTPAPGDTLNAQDSQGAINRPAGPVERIFSTVTTTGDNYGINIGVNLGRIIFGRDPVEDEQRRLVWYLDWLCGNLDQLRLHVLEKKHGQRGAGMSLSGVYTMLATEGRKVLARGQPEDVAQYINPDKIRRGRGNASIQSVKPYHRSSQALPDQAVLHLNVDTQEQELDVTLQRALLATEAVQQHHRLVLLGNPGSGKSTFVRHLALLLACRELGHTAGSEALPEGLTAKLPIILPLQRLSQRLATEGVSDAAVVAALKAELARSSVTQVDDLVSEALHRGAALLLFDGLDEVPLDGVSSEHVDRQTVVQAVRDFALHYSRVVVVLTCRVLAFTDDLRDHLGWPVETLVPFTLGQMRHFVPAWYGELVRTNQLQPEHAEYYQHTLIDVLMARLSLRKMAETPLLLTMMALVLYNKNELPRDRPRLYEDILDLLLRQWNTIPDKGGQTLTAAMGRPDWDSRNIVSLLDQLSYEAHRDATSEDGRGRLQRYAMQGRLSDHLQMQGMAPGEAGSAALHCLDYIEQRSGLLLPDENDSYVFAHLTLQEHCAGRHIALQSEDPIGLVLQHRDDDRWREPIFLGMGLADMVYLNQLLNELVDRDEGEYPKPVERWYHDLILAVELGKDRDWNYLQTQPRVKVKKLQAALRTGLVELLNDAAQRLPVAERVRAGFLLGELGDPRYPVKPEEWRQETARRNEQFGAPDGYWCYIRPDTYQIGGWSKDAPNNTEASADHELPGFWIARYPVTVAQYREFIDIDNDGYQNKDYWTKQGWEWKQQYNRTQPYLWGDTQYSSTNQAVIGVSWYECMAFCAWLTAQLDEMGYEVRLPTEAEWEVAAAYDGQMQRYTYPWGEEEPTPEYAFFSDNQDNKLGAPAPVGVCPTGAAPCGALDMVGQVQELCCSSYAAYSQGADVVLPEFQREDQDVPLRGGSWDDDRAYVQCSARDWIAPSDDGFILVGFRVLLSPRVA